MKKNGGSTSNELLENNLCGFDGVYFLTQWNRVDNLSVSIDKISDATTANIYVIPDSVGLNRIKNIIELNYSDYLDEYDYNQLNIGRLNKRELVTMCPEKWTVGYKRQAVVNHALSNNFKKILCIDDDIIFENTHLTKAFNVLHTHDVAAAGASDFPDHSIVGHAARSLGLGHKPFISGSFFSMNVTDWSCKFINIYNEDWFFFFAHMFKGNVATLPDTLQLNYDPYVTPCLAADQEFGDFLAETFLLLSIDSSWEKIDSIAFWSNQLKVRMNTISTIKGEISNCRARKSLEFAERKLKNINPEDCLIFVEHWKKINKI